MPYASSPTLAARRPATARASAHPLHDPGHDEITRPAGRPYVQPVDWLRLGFFGLGVALGALVGSSTALLLAPESGEETRDRLRRKARRFRGDAGDAWDDLRDELEWAARRGRRRIRRSLTRGRWAAEDVVDRGRRRIGV